MDLETKQKIEQEFLDNDMCKLNKICKFLIFKKNVPIIYHDDLYSIGRLTFVESINKYDASKDCKFETYLIGNIWRAFYDWTRDNMRWKRCNFQTDKDGKIMQDENDNPIIISDISIDAPTEDGTDIKEKIASDFNIEENISEEIGFSFDEKIEKYIKELPIKVQKVALLICQAYEKSDIMRILNIEEKQYLDAMKTMRQSEYTSILF